LAKATKTTETVPVTKYEQKTTGVTLTLSNEEARELRTVISDMHVDTDHFPHVNNIRKALVNEGFCYNGVGITGLVTKAADPLKEALKSLNVLWPSPLTAKSSF
jgi:hypothetical protein